MRLRKTILGLAMILILSSSVYGASKNVRRQSREKMTYNDSGVYQEAFYDYGSLIPGDNARITAISKGSNKNYAYIRFSDESMSVFKTKSNKNIDSTNRNYSYTSKYDVLDAGSKAHSKGAQELILNVIK